LQELKFIWTDKTRGIAKLISSCKAGITTDEIFVIAERQKDFPTVNQACRECRGDECDEIAKNDSIHPEDSSPEK